jgi:hypothetical protein
MLGGGWLPLAVGLEIGRGGRYQCRLAHPAYLLDRRILLILSELFVRGAQYLSLA